MSTSLYELAWRPAAAIIRRTDPMTAHARTLSALRIADGLPGVASVARAVGGWAFPDRSVHVGGVDLPQPLIVAAGLVKGEGFASEEAALAAVREGRDIVPGWRSLPALVGAVEFGSYTREPRLGNPGRVLWRDAEHGWMQNRIGLRNPGARAAAAYLARHAAELPAIWGLNLAVSPGVHDPAQSGHELVVAAEAFRAAFSGLEVGPAWVTLNLSCPNTADDPRGRQSAELARLLCTALDPVLQQPMWVKIGPDLAPAQLESLVEALAESGARAIVATNTLGAPAPGGMGMAGLSGSRLRPHALATVARLKRAIDVSGAPLDIVASGGILSGDDLRAFRDLGAVAAMIYTALVLRGPLAAALILREAAAGGTDA